MGRARAQVAWSEFGSHTQKRAPPPHTHTLPLTLWPWWEKPTKPEISAPRVCVCVRVLVLHTPHPTPPPSPFTPSLLLLRLWRRQLPTSCAGESGVGRGKRLNPRPWRLLLTAVGNSNEEVLQRGGGTHTVPRWAAAGLRKASQRHCRSLKFKTPALCSINQPLFRMCILCAGRSFKSGFLPSRSLRSILSK